MYVVILNSFDKICGSTETFVNIIEMKYAITAILSNTYRAEIGIFREISINIMAADALAPCEAWSSAAILLII